MPNPDAKPTFVFLGSSRLSVIVLDEMKKQGLLPILIVTTPDKPQGRKMEITPNIVKLWAVKNNITVISPSKLDAHTIELLTEGQVDVFVVASYGKIIPQNILDMPRRGTLNIHPSLLPLYRGASPLPSAMLDDAKETGVSIMKLDAEMDHGPIVSQSKVTVSEWPTYEDFEEMMAKEGAALLVQILPDWISGKIEAKEQDHSKATYTKKITKEDGLIDWNNDPYLNFRKIQAYHSWPQAYFFIEKSDKKLRVKITSASFGNGKLLIDKVIPEGGREMMFSDFERGYGGSVSH